MCGGYAQLAAIGLILFGVGMLTVAAWQYYAPAGGSRPGDLLARVRGERVTVEPPVTDMGADVVGQTRRFMVRLHNHTNRTVTIIGGTANCSCMVIDDLPISIPPGDSVLVTVRAGFKGTPGMFQQEFQFQYADGEKQGRVVARFAGRIVEAVKNEREKTP